MTQIRERIIASDLPLGTILKLKSAKGTVYRKLYKIQSYQGNQGKEYFSLWGILMDCRQLRTGYVGMVEDCGMTSNGHERFTHRVICEGGKMQLIPIRLVTEQQAKEEDEHVGPAI